MPVTGGTSKQVARTKFFAINPRWSPDSQKIAFINMQILAPEGPKSQLCVGSVSDGQVKTLIDSELGMEPAWSPDGTMLAYLRLKDKQGKLFNLDKMEGDLYIVPATGGESKRITNTPEKEMEISWIPDGKQLKIHGETWVVPIDGGNPQSWKGGISRRVGHRMGDLAFGHRGELQRVSPMQIPESSPFSPLGIQDIHVGTACSGSSPSGRSSTLNVARR